MLPTFTQPVDFDQTSVFNSLTCAPVMWYQKFNSGTVKALRSISGDVNVATLWFAAPLASA